MTELRRTTAAQIAEFLGAPLVGPDIPILRVAAAPPTTGATLCFVTRGLKDAAAPSGGALAIALPALALEAASLGYSVVNSEHPKFDFARAVDALMRIRPPSEIHPTALLDPTVRIGAHVIIGAYCVIEGDTEIGDGAWLGNRVTLSNRVIVGPGSRIRNGAVIGEDAYSHGFGPDYSSVRVPSLGAVRIGRNVEIGNNVVISRGVFNDTILHDESRVNDLAHIGNSTEIGWRTMVQANCDISSRCRIGKRCWISQSAAVRQGITIGDDVVVGMGAVVVKDIPSGTTAMGVPARVIGAAQKPGER